MGERDILFEIWFKVILTHSHTCQKRLEEGYMKQDEQGGSPFGIFWHFHNFFFLMGRN